MKHIYAICASALLLTCSCMLPHGIAQPAFAAEAEQTGTVRFDAKTGTLTLRGNVKTSEVQAFQQDPDIKKITAEKGTVLPEDCTGMFNGFQAESIDLSNADASGVTNMDSMFFNCTGLKTLDLTGFDTSGVQSMRILFSGCENLKTIYCSDCWELSNAENSDSMFSGCISLRGEYGTIYDRYHTDIGYAHPDSAVTPGYFTVRPEESSILTGDANGDGIVSVEDAQLALIEYVSIISGQKTTASAQLLCKGDVNGDEKITVEDAQMILLFYVRNTLSGTAADWDVLLSSQRFRRS